MKYGAPNFTVKTEGKRRFAPQRLTTSNDVTVVWEEDLRRVPVYAVPDGVGLLKKAQFYHFTWPFLSSLTAITALQRLRDTKTDDLNGSKHLRLDSEDSYFVTYTGCPSAQDWAEYAWLGAEWMQQTKALLPEHCIGRLPAELMERTTRVNLLHGIATPFENEMTSHKRTPGGRYIHCFRRGVAGAMDLRHYAARYQITNKRFHGRVKCGSNRCKFRRAGVEFPGFFGSARQHFHSTMAVKFGLPAPITSITGPASEEAFLKTPLTTEHTLIINRRGGGRSIRNAEQLRGDDVHLAYFEELSVVAQLRTVLQNDVIFGVHGSALAWSLFGKARTVWVEIAPRGSGRTHVLPDSKQFAVDLVGIPKVTGGRSIRLSRGGLEGYGLPVRYAGGHHISWYASCPLCTLCPEEDVVGNTTGSPFVQNWKLCSVFLPQSVFGAMRTTAAQLRKNPALCTAGCAIDVNDTQI